MRYTRGELEKKLAQFAIHLHPSYPQPNALLVSES